MNRRGRCDPMIYCLAMILLASILPVESFLSVLSTTASRKVIGLTVRQSTSWVSRLLVMNGESYDIGTRSSQQSSFLSPWRNSRAKLPHHPRRNILLASTKSTSIDLKGGKDTTTLSDSIQKKPRKTSKTIKKALSTSSSSSSSDKKKTNRKKSSIESSTTKKSKRHTKTKKTQEGPLHWTNSSDALELVWTTPADQARNHFHDMEKDGSLPLSNPMRAARLILMVRGNPLPLRRHRTSRGFVYNPSAKAQESFRQQVAKLVFGNVQAGNLVANNEASNYNHNPTMIHDPSILDHVCRPLSSQPPPLFGPNVTLAVTLILRLRRPLAHFRASNRTRAILKGTAPPPMLLAGASRTADTDNLAKFVLDACNGLLYHDDHQVQSLHVVKQFDDDGPCWGSTQLLIREVTGSTGNAMIQHALEPYWNNDNDDNNSAR